MVSGYEYGNILGEEFIPIYSLKTEVSIYFETSLLYNLLMV
jgi:hypothetical protein